MRRYPISVAIAVGAAVVISAGCSSGADDAKPGAATPTTASNPPATTMTTETHVAAPGAVGVSPNGVTTAVGAPAESTEDEYFQACHAAKVWMIEKGGDPKSQFEPYLRDLQSTDAAGPGTFGTPWSQLTPSRQSGVVVAAEAAARRPLWLTDFKSRGLEHRSRRTIAMGNARSSRRLSRPRQPLRVGLATAHSVLLRGWVLPPAAPQPGELRFRGGGFAGGGRPGPSRPLSARILCRTNN